MGALARSGEEGEEDRRKNGKKIGDFVVCACLFAFFHKVGADLALSKTWHVFVMPATLFFLFRKEGGRVPTLIFKLFDRGMKIKNIAAVNKRWLHFGSPGQSSTVEGVRSVINADC